MEETSGYASTYGTAGPTAMEPAGYQGQQTDQDLKQQAKDMTRQAGQAAGQLMDQARSQVKNQLSTGKDTAAGTLGAVAEALHTTGEQLRQKDHSNIGDYADRMAGLIDEASGYLRERNVDDLTREAEDFARQRPGMFLAGAVMLGFLAARCMKSSRSDGMGRDYRYETDVARSHGGGYGAGTYGTGYAGTYGGSYGAAPSAGYSGGMTAGMATGDGPVQTASGRMYDGDPTNESPRGEPITSPGMSGDMDDTSDEMDYAGTSRTGG